LHKEIKVRPEPLLALLEPFRDDLVVGVECMHCWYWISDLCEEHDINFILVHVLYMKAIHGGKTKNDRIDSFKIAMLMRGGNFPLAYGGKGKRRLSEPVERIIRDLLHKRFLTRQKRSQAAFYREVSQACKAQNLLVPASNTLALRIADPSPAKTARSRGGPDAARELQGVGGATPEVTLPLEQVQIDHTFIDLIVVDERDQHPVGRPYLTIAGKRHGQTIGSADDSARSRKDPRKPGGRLRLLW